LDDIVASYLRTLGNRLNLRFGRKKKFKSLANKSVVVKEQKLRSVDASHPFRKVEQYIERML